MKSSNEDVDVKTVEDYLNEVVYSNIGSYCPSDFALEFVTFIKLVNGGEGEENKTPVVHFKMLDTITEGNRRICNLCHRGIAKTTLMGEYLFLYLGVYGELPGFGAIDLSLYVSDSIENGVKNMRKNLEHRYENSDFLKHYIPKAKFTDIRWEFNNIDGKKFIIKGYGAKALSLDTQLFTKQGVTTIADVQVGDSIFGADGSLAKVTKKSEVFNRPMYALKLEDGRELKVSDEHINSVVIKENVNNTATYREADYLTKELLEMPLVHSRVRTRKGKPNYVSNERLMFVKNCAALEYPEKELPLDPYTLGLLLGDGSMKEDGSNVLHAHKDDMPTYVDNIPYTLGKPYVDRRNDSVVSQSIKGISKEVKSLGINVHGDSKFIPNQYLFGSINQRLELLKGLIDTDGSIQRNGRVDFCSNSEALVDGVTSLVRSLGGTTKKRKTGKAFRIEIWIEYVPCKLKRKALRFKHRTKNLVAVTSIERIADEPSQCIAIDNADHQFVAGDYFRTHNTGVRGAKEMGKRPQLAVLDDLFSDEDAKSPTVIENVEATIYKAVTYALHPKNNIIIWSGTPFNAKDPLYKAVESGAWAVNVFPVCEQFPCNKEDFLGSWPDRFTYEYVEEQYAIAVKTGKADTFNQELMLRIMSEEDRLILDADISWYKRADVLAHKERFNFYITTDFATSAEKHNDFSVISVWAYNNNGDWLWVDGICKKQLMDKNVNDLFRLAQMYRPQSVGIEVSGQQGGFVTWIQDEMMRRNVWFALASDNNGSKPGIRPVPNQRKIERFQVVVPWFKMNRVFFPRERKESPEIRQALDELTLVSKQGFKSKHDDFSDTISMLSVLTPWKPGETGDLTQKEDGMWGFEEEDTEDYSMSSYVV